MGRKETNQTNKQNTLLSKGLFWVGYWEIFSFFCWKSPWNWRDGRKIPSKTQFRWRFCKILAKNHNFLPVLAEWTIFFHDIPDRAWREIVALQVEFERKRQKQRDRMRDSWLKFCLVDQNCFGNLVVRMIVKKYFNSNKGSKSHRDMEWS